MIKDNTKNGDGVCKYMLITSGVYGSCLFFPGYLWLNGIVAVCLIFLFIRWPGLGVVFIIAVHPVVSCSYDVIFSVGQPLDIVATFDMPHGHSQMAPRFVPLTIYPFQIASLLVFPSLIFHIRPVSTTISKNIKVILLLLSICFVYSFVLSFFSKYPDKSMFGLLRFISITILSCYLIRFVNKLISLRSILVVFCCSSVNASLLAYFSTYYGFNEVTLIYSGHGITFFQVQSLFNTPFNFNYEVSGLLPGFGIAGKHEFAMLIVTGLLASVYLMYISTNKSNFIFYLLAVLMLYPGLYYAPCKVGIVSVFFAIFIISIISSCLRKHIVSILLVVFFLNIYALVVSDYTRPEHMKNTAGMSQSFKVINNSSQFGTGLPGRITIWTQAIRIIKESYSLGIGPEMLNQRLNHDHAFAYPTAHNILLTFCAEYGMPVLICLLLLAKLTFQRVFCIIKCSASFRDNNALLVIIVTICFVAIAFEYMFDLSVWRPQLWILGTIMWISGGVAQSGQTH